MLKMRGVRGAVQVAENTPDPILDSTRELLLAMVDANPGMRTEDLASVFFTVTEDLNAVHPALAARQLGWLDVPLLCAQEIPVPNSLPRVVRVLAHWNTDRPQNAIMHVYMGATTALRPDLVVSPFADKRGL